MGSKQLFSLCGEFPPGQRFAAVQKMVCRQQRIEHTGIMAVSHALSQRQIGRQRFMPGQLLRKLYPDRAQVGRDRFADIGDIFQPVRMSCSDWAHRSIRLHFPGIRDQLIEGLAPAFVKAHLRVLLASRFVGVDDGRGISSPCSVRGQSNAGREEKVDGTLVANNGRGSEAGVECIGPCQSFVIGHFQIAAEIGIFLSFRRQHHGAEDAAGAQVDLAIYGSPRHGAEPWCEMLRLCPCFPDQFPGHIDDALEREIKIGVGSVNGIHDSCPLSKVFIAAYSIGMRTNTIAIRAA